MNQALGTYMLAGGKNSIGLQLKYKSKYIFGTFIKDFTLFLKRMAYSLINM